MFNKKYSKDTLFPFLIYSTFILLYIGASLSIYLAIKKLKQSIKNSQQIVIECQNAITEITLKIHEELKRVKNLPRFKN
jgi:hypothetical protein